MRLGYPMALIFILCWWYCGFAKPPAGTSEIHFVKPSENIKPPLSDLLSPLSREEIKKALEGDLSLMVRLISEWDQDAQILEQQGFIEVERLPRRDFVNALMLGRRLKNKTAIQNNAANSEKYLPQTWASARFLLALLPPSQIIALDAGFARHHPEYSLPPLKPDSAEFIWKCRPACAFVAPYSNPGILQILKAQNIPVHSSRYLSNVNDIFEELKVTGQIVGKPYEAELMTLFMRSAMLAIDNRVKLLDPYEKTFYLSYGTHFSYPTTKTITGQLVSRLKLNQPFPSCNQLAWKVPLDEEELFALKPSRLIIACENPNRISLPPLNLTTEIALLEESLLESADQFVVLAYYDIYEALTR